MDAWHTPVTPWFPEGVRRVTCPICKRRYRTREGATVPCHGSDRKVESLGVVFVTTLECEGSYAEGLDLEVSTC